MSEWLQVAGRFHVLALHLPIGLLAGLAAIEALTLFRRDPGWLAAGRMLAALAALGAIASAVSGYILGLEGGYGDIIDTHRNLGIAVAVAAAMTALFYVISSNAWPRRVGLALTLALLIPAGHLGGTMTHGETFLFEPLSRSQPAPKATPAAPTQSRTDEYSLKIQPILARSCYTCHGPSKRKGDLALDTPAAILQGGRDGPVISPGKPEESELLVRLRLPMDDDDHMPPEGKPQPSESDIAALEAWIASGAAMPASDPGATPTAPRAADPAPPPAPTGPPPAAAADLARLRERLVHVEPLSQDSRFLIVSVAAIAPQVDDDLARELLEPLRPQLVELTLARSAISDKTLEFLAEFPNLRHLDVRGTSVTAAGVAALANHPALEDLNLAQTKLSDEAAGPLKSIRGLKRLYLWKAGLTPEAVADLRAALVGVVVDTGDRSETRIADQEGEVKLSSDAPPLGAPAAPTELKAVNAVCPVSGSPVNPKYLVVYKGRVIGFCCPNCPKEFWTDPEKFESKLP